MEIVEPGTETIIHDLQRKGYCIMGLTTQGLALATRTSQQLLEQTIDLKKTAPSQIDHYLILNDHGVLYRNGILFTSGRNKGDAFFHFCDQIHYQPKRIVFVNDKASHLSEIEAAAEKRGIEFLGLRYSYSDKRKKEFDITLAEYEFHRSVFSHILTDDEARLLMKEESFQKTQLH